mmetsp:Transcript_8856/g.13413  ORF Transcript_8856/g.13413 Transcript_8856/m.13413 type:complete len:197 (-) Transcript_8856:116-706(-)
MHFEDFHKRLLAFTGVAALSVVVYRLVTRRLRQDYDGDDAPDFTQMEQDACTRSFLHDEADGDEESEWLTMDDEEETIVRNADTQQRRSRHPIIDSKKRSQYDKDMLTMALMELLMEEEMGKEAAARLHDRKRRKTRNVSKIPASRRTASMKNSAPSPDDIKFLHDALAMLENEDEFESDPRVEILVSDSENQDMH